MNTPVERKSAFLEELDREIAWEWKWEKHNRRCGVGINWSAWVARLLLLAFCFYLANRSSSQPVNSWFSLSLAILSLLNVALPLLAYTFRFQQRQEVHDSNARKYNVIRVAYLSDQLSIGEALSRFAEIRKKPTEKTIRNTP